jgi:8-oxo-dGTP diphosphatase
MTCPFLLQLRTHSKKPLPQSASIAQTRYNVDLLSIGNNHSLMVRRGMNSQKPIYGVGAVVYRVQADHTIEILLIRKHKGFWSLPKGKIKGRESAIDAIVREVREETHVTAEVVDMLGSIDYIIHGPRGEQRKIVDYYLLHAIKGRARPMGGREQIVAVEWVPLAEALERLQRPRLRAIVRIAQTLFSR